MERVGIRDHFCPTARDLDELMDHCGLSVAEVLPRRSAPWGENPDDIP